MAQKVNPISLRIQSGNNQFSSNWYSNSQYSVLLSQDIKTRHYFYEIFKQLNNTKPRILITQSTKNVVVDICYLSSTKSRTFRSRRFAIPYNSRKKAYTWKQTPKLNKPSSKILKKPLKGENRKIDLSSKNIYKEVLFYNLRATHSELKRNHFIRWQTTCQNTKTEDLGFNRNKSPENLSPVRRSSLNKTKFKEKWAERFSFKHTFLFSLWYNQNKNNLLGFLQEIMVHLSLKKETLRKSLFGLFAGDIKLEKLLFLSKLALNGSKPLSYTSLVDKKTKRLSLPLYSIKEGLNKKRLNLLSSKTETSFLFHILTAVLSANIITKREDLLPFVYKISSLHLFSNWNTFLFLRYLNLFSEENLKSLRLKRENKDITNNFSNRNPEFSSNSLVTANKQVLEIENCFAAPLLTNLPYSHFVESKSLSIVEDLRSEKQEMINRWKNFLREIVSRSLPCQVNLNWYKVLNESQSAIFLANELSYYLERKIDSRKLIYQICKETKTERAVQGIRVSCSGRLGGRSKKAQRSKTICIRLGKTSLNLFSSYIDFAKTSVLTRFGLIGIKVWVCYKS